MFHMLFCVSRNVLDPCHPTVGAKKTDTVSGLDQLILEDTKEEVEVDGRVQGEGCWCLWIGEKVYWKAQTFHGKKKKKNMISG